MRASRGYLTLAARDARYLEMAVDMALSLRQHTDLPIVLAADDELGEIARTRYGAAFTAVTRVPERFRRGRALKYGTAEASPFDETTFVDADCLVLGSLDHLFDALDRADMAMTGEQLGADEDRDHHGFSTTWLIRRFGLATYLKTNSGLFCFRREPALAIMEACLACHTDEVLRLRWMTLFGLSGKWLGDELAFGIVGGRRGLGTLPKPDAMYWPEEIAALDLRRPGKPLLHMLWPLEAEQLDQLVEGTAARRRAAGVPGDAAAHWREESRRLERLRKRRRR
ncbi:MAG: hypothetical protein AB7T31_12845 [Gemmatimonadales bacterium]